MAMSRSFGAMLLTTLPPMRSSPSVMSSRPGDHVQRRRLPAARRADEDDELAVGDVEVDLVDGQRAVGIALGDVVQDDVGHWYSLLLFG